MVRNCQIATWFEKDLTHVTATYTLKKNGMVKVEKRGKEKRKPKIAIGKQNSRMKKTIGYLRVAFSCGSMPTIKS